MKKVVDFLCRFPGILIVSIVILCSIMLRYREHLDERRYMLIFFMFAITFVANVYLFFIQGEKLGWHIKGAKWIGISFAALMLGLAIPAWIGLTNIKTPKFPGDHYLQKGLLELLIGITLWGVFTLLWNMNMFSIIREQRKLRQRKSTPIQEYKKLLDEQI